MSPNVKEIIRDFAEFFALSAAVAAICILALIINDAKPALLTYCRHFEDDSHACYVQFGWGGDRE